ncbi:MAG: hypothetical protein LBC03_05865 [Nitrososphaerota archaeon]|jgi:hypothetical protein|nr:hypothetical protein [Nitrososphaerota archaeon]
MKSSEISFNGKTPSEQEYEQLTCGFFDKTPFSFVGRNRKIIEGFLCFLSGIGGVVFSWFLFWTKIPVDIPFGSMFTAALLGFSFSLFYQGFKCFRSRPTKQNFKKSQHVLHQYVKCLFDINYFHTGTIDIGNSYATLQRMLPESQRVDYKTFETYSENSHSKIIAIAKNDTKTLNLIDDCFKVSSVVTSVTSNKTIAQNIERLSMEVNLYVETTTTQSDRTIWKKFKPTIVSHVKLIFNMTLVQLDEYWFVYDPLPDYE